MQSLKAFFALVVACAICTPGAMAQARFGAQAAEGEPNRMQPWLVPSPDQDTAAHALLFRPPGDGPFRLTTTVSLPTGLLVSGHSDLMRLFGRPATGRFRWR